jgi:hypothetical protein
MVKLGLGPHLLHSYRWPEVAYGLVLPNLPPALVMFILCTNMLDWMSAPQH